MILTLVGALGALVVLGLGLHQAAAAARLRRHDRWLADYHRQAWTRGDDGPCWQWAELQRQSRIPR